jgi:hemerythrin-like domain-containing protein
MTPRTRSRKGRTPGQGVDLRQYGFEARMRKSDISENARAVSAYEIAASTICREHHGLSVVLQVLQRLLADIEKGHTEPDYTIFTAAIYYIADFPERCHHPKEDELLFDALRRRTTEFNTVLDELQADHVRSGQMVSCMERALVHYQAGAPGGFARFKDAVEAYAVLLREHMQTEEHVLEHARARLTEDDWARLAAAFEVNDDPLFGTHGRDEFRRLYLRIVNLLPRKMRLHPVTPER